MQKTNIITAALVILALAFSFAAAVTTVSAANDFPASAYLTFSLVNQNPDPVSPGEQLELRLKIENNGAAPLQDVVVDIVPGFPFSVDETERMKSLGTVSGLQNGKDAVIVKFLLTVDSNAGTGVSPVMLRYKSAGQDWSGVSTVNVSIRQRDLPLSISSAAVQPERLIQGRPASLNLEITNFGSTAALNVRVKLNATDTFMPASSAIEQYIPSIIQRGKATAKLDFITSATAKSGFYRMPVLITYSDSSGKNYTVSQSFSVTVGDVPQLVASLLKSDLLRTGVKGTVTIEIINKEWSDMKFLSAALAKSDSYEVLSPDSVYIGDLDSGDSSTVDYDVFFRQPGQLLLNLEYADPFNSVHQQQVEVPVRLYSNSEIRMFGLQKSKGLGILIVIVIAAVGIFAYRMFRRRKKQ